MEVKVTFETITPLLTGNAWGECREIKPASLIGSLRFWFEVICYFSEIVNENDYNFSLKRFEKNVDYKEFKKYILKYSNSFETKIKALLEQNIPIPAIVFGTTGWRSLIRIKKIKPIEDYCFGNRLNLPNKICINKQNYEIEEQNECHEKSNQEYSVFYFPNPYFFGKFEVIFEVEKNILESIFYPLLNFMEKYGYWGGKWNIGFGRLKIRKIEIKKENNWEEIENWKEKKFDFSIFGKGNINFSELVDEINCSNIDIKKNDNEKVINTDEIKLCLSKIFEKKIKLIKINICNEHYLGSVKKLLKIKLQMRDVFKKDENFDENQHAILGSTKKSKKEGSKILPYISENGIGFISIVGRIFLSKSDKITSFPHDKN